MRCDASPSAGSVCSVCRVMLPERLSSPVEPEKCAPRNQSTSPNHSALYGRERSDPPRTGRARVVRRHAQHDGRGELVRRSLAVRPALGHVDRVPATRVEALLLDLDLLLEEDARRKGRLRAVELPAVDRRGASLVVHIEVALEEVCPARICGRDGRIAGGTGGAAAAAAGGARVRTPWQRAQRASAHTGGSGDAGAGEGEARGGWRGSSAYRWQRPQARAASCSEGSRRRSAGRTCWSTVSGTSRHRGCSRTAGRRCPASPWRPAAAGRRC